MSVTTTSHGSPTYLLPPNCSHRTNANQHPFSSQEYTSPITIDSLEAPTSPVSFPHTPSHAQTALAQMPSIHGSNSSKQAYRGLTAACAHAEITLSHIPGFIVNHISDRIETDKSIASLEAVPMLSVTNPLSSQSSDAQAIGIFCLRSKGNFSPEIL